MAHLEFDASAIGFPTTRYATEAQLLRAMGSHDPFERSDAVRSMYATTQVVAMGAIDAAAVVRQSAASSVKCSPADLEVLARDPNRDVRIAVAANANLTSAHIDILLADTANAVVRIDSLASTSVTADQLDRGLADPVWQVRMAAASNPKMTVEQLGRALNDKSYLVRAAAAENRSASIEQVVAAGSDPSQYVRDAAAANKVVPVAWRAWLSAGWKMSVVRQLVEEERLADAVSVESLEALMLAAQIGLSPNKIRANKTGMKKRR